MPSTCHCHVGSGRRCGPPVSLGSVCAGPLSGRKKSPIPPAARCRTPMRALCQESTRCSAQPVVSSPASCCSTRHPCKSCCDPSRPLPTHRCTGAQASPLRCCQSHDARRPPLADKAPAARRRWLTPAVCALPATPIHPLVHVLPSAPLPLGARRHHVAVSTKHLSHLPPGDPHKDKAVQHRVRFTLPLPLPALTQL
jgi:hypothetical protein